MRKLSSLIYSLLSFLLLATTLQGVELDWEHDFHRALLDAKKEQKIVYLFLT